MGLGGADLYVSKRLDDTWPNGSTPENLGEPINTPGARGSMCISVDAEENIYIAMAGKSIDGGNLDIYHVVLEETARRGREILLMQLPVVL